MQNKAVADYFCLDDHAFCPHDRYDECKCRKPQRGMIDLLLSRHGLNPQLTPMFVIGDRRADIELADRIGAVPIFIEHFYCENASYVRPKNTVSNTLEALRCVRRIHNNGD